MTFTTNQTAEPQTASFYTDLEFSDKSVVITPMLDSTFGKEIRIAFKEGQIMKEHKTNSTYKILIIFFLKKLGKTF